MEARLRADCRQTQDWSDGTKTPTTSNFLLPGGLFLHRLFDLHIRGKQLLMTEELPLFFLCHLHSPCSVTPKSPSSCLPLFFPSQQQGQPGSLSERGQALSAFSVCGRGLKVAFWGLFVWWVSWTSFQQKPPLTTPCPSPSTQASPAQEMVGFPLF